MRIYIIGNDGITLCREPPATVDKGEIAVSSNEELHAARLSGKRLLALWNALPGIEKRTKVGDRETLIDQLWSAVEALPDPDPQAAAKRPSKQDAVISMLQRPEGATVALGVGVVRGDLQRSRIPQRLQQDLLRLVSSGGIERRGEGSPADPYTYHPIRSRRPV
jgi:hypothetical protein